MVKDTTYLVISQNKPVSATLVGKETDMTRGFSRELRTKIVEFAYR